MVRSCLLITLVTCLKGHKSLRVLFCSLFQKWQSVSQSVSESVSDKGTYRAVWGTAKKKVKIIDQIEMFKRMASILSSNRDEAG